MTDTTTQIASIGKPWHPPVKDVVETFRSVADRLNRSGPNAIALASVLAANGYPSSTLGDGGSRGTDGTSSTERAAGVMADKPRRDHWRDVDRNLASAFAIATAAVKDLDSLVADIVQHAEDLDPVPVGTGECQACGRFCRPDKDRPGNRLCSGLCPTDYRAWRRYTNAEGKLPRNDWIHQRRGSFTDEKGVLHTPEPDHDIDLTTELPSA